MLRHGQPHKGEYEELISAEADVAYRESLIRADASDTLWAIARIS